MAKTLLDENLTGQLKPLMPRITEEVELIASLDDRDASADLQKLLEDIAANFHRITPAGTPPLWVTSMTRSIEHQERLRSLGYSAVLPSAHCTGHAVDLEMRWFERFGVADKLAEVLWTHQAEGLVNVINEGQAWHVCISPHAVARLRTPDDTRIED